MREADSADLADQQAFWAAARARTSGAFKAEAEWVNIVIQRPAPSIPRPPYRGWRVIEDGQVIDLEPQWPPIRGGDEEC